MEAFASRFIRRANQHLRGTPAALRRASAVRLKRVRRWRRWFVRGAIVGVIWAMRYAPQSGAETRAAVGAHLGPLAASGTSLYTWLRTQQHARQDRLAARRAQETAGNTTQEWAKTPCREDMSGAAAEREYVERERSRLGTREEGGPG